MRKKFNKVPRKAMTVTMAIASMISLSACTSTTNSYGNIESDEIYAQAGEFKVTNADLWSEFKWDAASDMEAQFTNVVLNNEITRITLVLKNDYTTLSEDDKKLFIDSEDENDTEFSKEEYDELYTKYSERLIDYVVQDIYSLTYTTDRYWSKIDLLDAKIEKYNVEKYVDELFSNYKIDEIDGTSIKNIVNNANEASPEGYLTIGKYFSQIYYPLLAKEILAEETLAEIAWDSYDDDVESSEESGESIEEDSYVGYYSTADIVSEFKSLYANQFDLNLVMIRFNTEDELKNTYRAFGVKAYDDKFYFITKNEGETYTEYCDRYDDITNPKTDYEQISDASVLEIFIQMYNYIYSGYRHTLTTNYPFTGTETLSDLYEFTRKIIIANNSSNSTDEALIAEVTQKLMTNDAEYLTYTREDIDEVFVSAMVDFLYDELSTDAEDTLRYSSDAKNYNDSYYITYKLGQANDEYGLYDKTLTTDELVADVILADGNENIFKEIYTAVIHSKVTETAMDDYVDARIEDITVKIFDEATMITYSKTHEYSKTTDKAPSDNCVAIVTYDGCDYHYNIKADSEDEASIMIPGKDEAYGAFDSMVLIDGTTTAIDLLSNQIIKTTSAYDKTNEDRQNYEDYIETIIYNFVNDGLSSYGYSSELGTYNFMMLYWHSADIDAIIDDYYRVQYASQDLLTDYSNPDLVAFLKQYTDSTYDTYFSIGGTRLVVYFDGDDDTEADDVSEWATKTVEFNGVETELQVVAKQFIYDIYNEINASDETHSTRLTEIVEEINSSARVQFDENPILAENQWAQYRKVGLNVMTEEFTATNSTTDIDFSIKSRAYDYARGHNEDNTITYQYFINGSTPSEYLQEYIGTKAEISQASDKQIVQTEDGFNLLLITSGTSSSSAKWSHDDHDEDLLNNIVVKYNDKYVTIPNLYNENDKLNENQISLYVLEQALSGSSSLLPSDINDAISAFLSPVYTRYTGTETQRVIILYFIELQTGAKIINDTSIFTNEDDNNNFSRILDINRRLADSYNDIYCDDSSDIYDPTNTVDSFPDWWTKLEASVAKFLLKEEKSND